MTALAEVADLGIERLARIEERISGAEDTGLRARWEFGRELLAARDGKGRLPNGYLKAVAERTGASRTELTYRTQFAERYPEQEQLLNAIEQFGSWFAITQKALARAVEPDGAKGYSPLWERAPGGPQHTHGIELRLMEHYETVQAISGCPCYLFIFEESSGWLLSERLDALGKPVSIGSDGRGKKIAYWFRSQFRELDRIGGA